MFVISNRTRTLGDERRPALGPLQNAKSSVIAAMLHVRWSAIWHKQPFFIYNCEIKVGVKRDY